MAILISLEFHHSFNSLLSRLLLLQFLLKLCKFLQCDLFLLVEDLVDTFDFLDLWHATRLARLCEYCSSR